MDGGAGNDTLIGGPGRDTLKGGPGDDKLLGGDNDDVLYGDEGRDDLNGGSGVDTVFAGPGGDTVRGGAGREVIRGGDDADFLYAGTGFYGSIITGGKGNDTIIGSSGVDLLDGEDGNDTILGGDLGDTIRGGADHDTLIGELGRDNISGDAGEDLIYTHLNNDVRASLDLAPISDLTAIERQSRYDQLVADLPALQSQSQTLLAIPESQRTPEQLAQLQVIQDAIAISLLSQADLLQYQSIYVDRPTVATTKTPSMAVPTSIFFSAEMATTIFMLRGDICREASSKATSSRENLVRIRSGTMARKMLIESLSSPN